MALLPCSRLPSGIHWSTRRCLFLLWAFVLIGLIYLLSRKQMTLLIPAIPLQSERRGQVVEGEELPVKTHWGAPLVWGDSESSVWRRDKFAHQDVRIGLAVLAVGKYNHFLHQLFSSAELHFLLNLYVTYYVLTDRPQELDPPPKLGPTRELRIVPVAEMPGWDRLSLRRMALLASVVGERIHLEVDYIFCIDADQEFTNTVGAEILGKLTTTLHPEYYGKPRYYYPYENDPDSMAYIAKGEGDYYYTSEFYGGLCSEVLAMTRACSLLILQDQERGVKAQELEESYLNRYLVNHRPTCVLSPEYSWWNSPQAPIVPTQRLHSIGRECLSTGKVRGDKNAC